MIQKVEDIKRPLIVGEYLNVLCIIENDRITPVYNHPHNDKENGQPDIHYHMDSRFVYEKQYYSGVSLGNRIFKKVGDTRIYLTKFLIFKRINLRVQRTEEIYKTPLSLIKNSKFKCKIINNKCPHRGYDLSQIVENEEGEIICPLHGLKLKIYDKNRD